MLAFSVTVIMRVSAVHVFLLGAALLQVGMALRLKNPRATLADSVVLPLTDSTWDNVELDFLEKGFPSFGKSLGASVRNFAQAAAGGNPITCKPQPEPASFQKTGESAIDGHWATICPAWGGRPDPKTGHCRIEKKALDEEFARVQGCMLEKKLKPSLMQAMAGSELAVNTQLATADGILTQVVEQFLPTAFSTLDVDGDKAYSVEDFKAKCVALNQVDLYDDAAVGRFADTEMPTKVMDGVMQMTKVLPEQLLSVLKLNSAFDISKKRRVTEAMAFLCSECSSGVLDGWNLAGDSMFEDSQKSNTQDPKAMQRRALKSKWDQRLSMWTVGSYKGPNGETMQLADVGPLCSGKSKKL